MVIGLLSFHNLLFLLILVGSLIIHVVAFSWRPKLGTRGGHLGFSIFLVLTHSSWRLSNNHGVALPLYSISVCTTTVSWETESSKTTYKKSEKIIMATLLGDQKRHFIVCVSFKQKRCITQRRKHLNRYGWHQMNGTI